MFFFHAEDFSPLNKLGWRDKLLTQPFAMGVLAQTIPAFACREPLAYKLLGPAMNSLEQARHDSNLETNLAARAELSARIFALDTQAALQKATFREFVHEAGRHKRRLVLLDVHAHLIVDYTDEVLP